MYITKMWPLLVLGGIVTHITTKLHVHGVSIKKQPLMFSSVSRRKMIRFVQKFQ